MKLIRNLKCIKILETLECGFTFQEVTRMWFWIFETLGRLVNSIAHLFCYCADTFSYWWCVDTERYISDGLKKRVIIRICILAAAFFGCYYTYQWYAHRQKQVVLMQKELEKYKKSEKDTSALLIEVERFKSSEARHKVEIALAHQLIISFEQLLNENKAKLNQNSEKFKNAQQLDRQYHSLRQSAELSDD